MYIDQKQGFGSRLPKTYQELLLNSQEGNAKELSSILTLSDDSAAFQVGVLVVENASAFWLKFFMYDEVSAEHDYPLAKSFSKQYTPSLTLMITLPYQVMMSTKRPPEEIRIDHLKEIDTHFGFPSDSYAYTALDPFII